MNYCPNCGNQLKDGVNFCTNCGTPVKNKPAAAPTPQPTPQPVKNTPQKTTTKQKSGGVKVGRIIILVIFILIVIGIVVGTNNEKKNDDLYSGNNDYQVDELDIANPEYTAIFTDRGISDTSVLVDSGLSTSEFVIVDAEGMIDKMEYGYSNDIVEVLIETIYYPVSSYSDDEKAQIETAIKDDSSVEALPFVTVNYNMGSDYFKIEIITEDLDVADNIQAAEAAGIIETTDLEPTLISYSLTEPALLAAGYIKK